MLADVARWPEIDASIAVARTARMTTVHELQPQESGGTRIVVQIRIEGPMAWFWGVRIWRPQADDVNAIAGVHHVVLHSRRRGASCAST